MMKGFDLASLLSPYSELYKNLLAISRFSHIPETIKPGQFVILNTNISDNSSGHWTVLYHNYENNSYELFNSLGFVPNSATERLYKTYLPKRLFCVITNSTRLQSLTT